MENIKVTKMKKAVLASAVIAAMASGSSLAATVYSSDGTELKIGGRVEFRGDFIGTSDGAEIEGSMDDSTRARINLKGQTQLSESLTGFGVYEAEHKTGAGASNSDNSDTEIENRYMYAGMKGNFGELSFGRQDMASVIVSDMTDITEFSGIQQTIDSSSDKEDSVIAYSAHLVEALQLKATFRANDEKDEDGYSLAGFYSLPMGLDLGLSFSGADLGTSSGSESQILAGLGYTFDALYLGASYSTGDLNDKATGATDKEFTAMEFVAQYQFTDQFSAAALYTNQENEAANGTKADATDGVEVVGYYKFNGNFRTYLSYYLNGLTEVKDGNGIVTAGEDTLRLGVRYDF